MFKDKTLLILGAGASFEVGLPLGDKLKERISTVLKVVREPDAWDMYKIPDQRISAAIDYVVKTAAYQLSRDLLIDASRRISDALPLARSIDNYLDSHKDSKAIELCGKLAIVRCILIAERKSKLHPENWQTASERVVFSNLAGTWFNRFGSLLFESTLGEMLNRMRNLAVIAFNYDRCFEHFMYHSILTYYDGVTPAEAARYVNEMTIYHPYGTVGKLRWMDGSSQSPCDFGEEEISGERLVALAKNIKTYTEGVDRESSEIKAIHTAVRKARTVVTLGFGYIPLNMQLLKPDDSIPNGDNSPNKTYYGTAYGMSDEDTLIVSHAARNLVSASRSVDSKINNKLTCANLFTEYAFSLGET
ncbi:hypothetical protein [Mesorhizobium sophorae]|uniref:hypothetical protein n=1 Tax=Mesorhizobium sophorae TaxID=1300294 RepID=UPI000BA2DFEF|nr:hypothetical protein [Mesorhizobium sophorae]